MTKDKVSAHHLLPGPPSVSRKGPKLKRLRLSQEGLHQFGVHQLVDFSSIPVVPRTCILRVITNEGKVVYTGCLQHTDHLASALTAFNAQCTRAVSSLQRSLVSLIYLGMSQARHPSAGQGSWGSRPPGICPHGPHGEGLNPATRPRRPEVTRSCFRRARLGKSRTEAAASSVGDIVKLWTVVSR